VARDLALAGRALDRWGIACRRTVPGFDALRPQLERLEREGRVLRTSFLAKDDGDEFSAPAVVQAWRAARGDAAGVVLAACDPANPFGAVLPWPRMARQYRPRRVAGARVLIGGGRLLGYLTRTGRCIHTPVDLADPAPLVALLHRAAAGGPVYLQSVNGEGPYDTPWHGALVEGGFLRRAGDTCCAEVEPPLPV
jgi:ATP-dependent helicase Lhr and Lhr-like helicase